MDFFSLHPSENIGFKKLTPSDLGIKGSSGQTHIGLYKDVLNFLDNHDFQDNCIFIYDNKCSYLKCYFDRIKEPNGSYRSPKIRKGRDQNSVVDKIRDIVKKNPSKKLYLVWGSLDSEQIFFWVMTNDSADYHFLSKNKIKFSSRSILRRNDSRYTVFENFFTSKLNKISIKLQKDMELESQIWAHKEKYGYKNLEKADQYLKAIGRRGEKLVDQRLKKELHDGTIQSYEWMNKEMESGMPYDFIIDKDLKTEKFVDVKTTCHDFNQYLYYSNSEIQFIYSLRNKKQYFMYRIILTEKSDELKVCSKCNCHMFELHLETKKFKTKLEQNNAKLQNAKIAIRPKDFFQKIETLP